jgi:hypothetical protein
MFKKSFDSFKLSPPGSPIKLKSETKPGYGLAYSTQMPYRPSNKESEYLLNINDTQSTIIKESNESDFI